MRTVDAAIVSTEFVLNLRGCIGHTNVRGSLMTAKCKVEPSLFWLALRIECSVSISSTSVLHAGCTCVTMHAVWIAKIGLAVRPRVVSPVP